MRNYYPVIMLGVLLAVLLCLTLYVCPEEGFNKFFGENNNMPKGWSQGNKAWSGGLPPGLENKAPAAEAGSSEPPAEPAAEDSDAQEEEVYNIGEDEMNESESKLPDDEDILSVFRSEMVAE